MNTYNTLKYATFLALIVLGIGVSGNAVAIGLDDMDVKSHLGQPLRAQVKVHGINKLDDASCFKLANSSDSAESLQSANFKLTNVIGDEATLLISSAQAINEPILNVSLVTECDALTTVRRDYVVLIDPLLIIETDANSAFDNTAVTTTTEVTLANTKHKPSRRLTTVDGENQVAQAVATQSDLPKKTNKRHQNSSTIKQNTTNVHVLNDDLTPNLSSTPTITTTQSKAIDAKKTVGDINKASTPRLSISGNSPSNTNVADSSLSLRLDSQLHFTPSKDPQAFSTETEVLDEVTVMNNRLAHLEKQLITLQTRNTVLESAGKAHLQQIEQAKEQASILRWLAYLFCACVLIGAAFLAYWRRRNQRMQLESDINWTHVNNNTDHTNLYSNLDLDNGFVHDIEIGSAKKDDLATITEADNFDQTAVTPAFMANKVETVIIEEDILDHADVFISHGRINLAIQLLQNHLSEHPDRSVTVWLFLLDLLASEGAEEEYEMSASECKNHFNIELPEYAVPSAKNNNGLEYFAALTSHLTNVWQTDEAVSFLDGLIYNNRSQPRSGFNHSTFEELALLKGIAQEHQQTAQIIPLFQKAPTIKVEDKRLVVANNEIEMTKTGTDNESITLRSILADASTEESSLETTKEKPEEFNIEFNLVEWR